MTDQLNIKKITVLKNEGTDICVVEFENKILEGMWPFENNLKMKFEVAKGRGADYVRSNFPNTNIEVIKIV